MTPWQSVHEVDTDTCCNRLSNTHCLADSFNASFTIPAQCWALQKDSPRSERCIAIHPSLNAADLWAVDQDCPQTETDGKVYKKHPKAYGRELLQVNMLASIWRCHSFKNEAMTPIWLCNPTKAKDLRQSGRGLLLYAAESCPY